MSCTKDDKCINIVNRYNTNKREIAILFNSANSSIMEVDNALKELVIPDDYLGSKVLDSINKIEEYSNNCSMFLKSIENDINNYIARRQNEHQQHYNDWKNKK